MSVPADTRKLITQVKDVHIYINVIKLWTVNYELCCFFMSLILFHIPGRILVKLFILKQSLCSATPLIRTQVIRKPRFPEVFHGDQILYTTSFGNLENSQCGPILICRFEHQIIWRPPCSGNSADETKILVR